jgi:hypothetical protein
MVAQELVTLCVNNDSKGHHLSTDSCPSQIVLPCHLADAVIENYLFNARDCFSLLLVTCMDPE